MRLGHSTCDIYDRLKSIEYEALLAHDLSSQMYPSIPCCANERAGSWYVASRPVQTCAHSGSDSYHRVYFKSTDGHVGQWDVNVRRLNLHIIPTIIEHCGIFIIDTTKQGKTFPDSLSKTIPLWACVLNRLKKLYYCDSCGEDWDDSLYLPVNVAISELESSEMKSRVDSIVQKLSNLEAIDWRQVLQNLNKPLRPIWLHPGTRIFHDGPISYEESNFYPVILYSACDRENGELYGLRNGFRYVQGAGDDHESWAPRYLPSPSVKNCPSIFLTRELFWANREFILGDGRDACASRIESILIDQAKSIMVEESSSEKANNAASSFDWVFRGDDESCPFHIAVGSRPSGRPPHCFNTFDAVLNLTMFEYEEELNEGSSTSWNIVRLKDVESENFQGEDEIKKADNCNSACFYIHCPIKEGKAGKKAMSVVFPRLLFHLLKCYHNFRLKKGPTFKLLIHCQQGKDRSVCFALFLITLLKTNLLAKFLDPVAFESQFKSWSSLWSALKSEPFPLLIDKQFFKNELVSLQLCRSVANPSRDNFKVLNLYFLSNLK